MTSNRWWREPEVGLLAVLVLAIFGSRLHALPLRGEEPRRARIAVEMIESGDWIVPRQQGQPFLSRPPLQNWVIGLLGLARGHVNTVAIRLPSMLAILCMTLLIYGYARGFMSRVGATASAAAYATAGHVLELGRLGETESLFTLFVGGSLLAWHWAPARGGRTRWGWIIAYVFVALGTLTKGPQAPIYFALSVGVYLLVTARWRDALTLWHLAGVVIFAGLLALWLVPFWRMQGWAGTAKIFGYDVGLRFDDTRGLTLLKHLASYPFEVLGCLLPWSALLVAYVRRDFRALLKANKINGGAAALFLVIAVAVTFPTCWLTPGAKTRYFMPLYPCFAILSGIVIERCSQADAAVPLRSIWRWFLWVMAAVMCAVGAGTVIGRLDGPWPLAAGYATAVAVLVAAALWAAFQVARPERAWQASSLNSPIHHARPTLRVGARGSATQIAIVSVATFVGLTWTTAVLNVQLRTANDTTAPAVAALREGLPPGTHLASFSWVDPLFAYYYRAPIRYVPWPTSGETIDPAITYFCYGNDSPLPGPVTVDYDEVARISCDRNQGKPDHRVVIVGKRKEPAR